MKLFIGISFILSICIVRQSIADQTDTDFELPTTTVAAYASTIIFVSIFFILSILLMLGLLRDTYCNVMI